MIESLQASERQQTEVRQQEIAGYTMAMSLIQSLLTSVRTQISRITGTTIIQEEPFDAVVVPGLTTLFDVALYNTYEGQLTATVTSGHNLLHTWIDIKHQAIKILNLLQKYHDMDEMNKINLFHRHNHNAIRTTTTPQQYTMIHNTVTATRYHALEVLARTCVDVACDAIQRLTTDRWADTANLSWSAADAAVHYDNHTNLPNDTNHNTTNNNNNKGGKNNSSNNNNNNNNNASTSNNNNNNTSASMSAMVTSLLESANDTGRRFGSHVTTSSMGASGGGNNNNASTVVYRSTDCWESPRLVCPDYIWADDAANHAQRIVRLLFKNHYVVSNLDMNPPNNNNNNVNLTAISSSNSDELMDDDAFYTNGPFITFLPVINTKIEQEASLLLLAVTRDLPSRLVQFRASIEADAIVMKRLYLVKLEYRAPFRTFLESHQSLQRAPSLTLVMEYLQYPKNKLEEHRNVCKDNLQQLLMQPYLVEALALEKKCEEYELAMTETLYGFSELSRYLLLKRACIIPPLEDEEDSFSCHMAQLRVTIRRLKGILCRKAGTDISTGIRPLLLDLQGIPRDEERYDKSIVPSYFVTVKDFDRRLDLFILQLQTLRKLCVYTKRHCFFRSDKKVELEIPASIVRGCETFDEELFRCHCVDWFSMIRRQHEIFQQHRNFDEIAEQIRKAEIQLSLAAATNQSLDVVRVRLETLESDREKRYQVMKEIVEDLCLREMNLQVHLTPPMTEKAMALQPTSAFGIFGRALQMAGEALPLG